MGLDERILVVPREAVNPYHMYGAVEVTQAQLHTSLYQHATSRVRGDVEEDESFLQVIPYVVVHEGSVVLGARRLGGGNERRLHDSYLAGFGGHVKWSDNADPETLVHRAVRHELHEELGQGMNLQVPRFTHLLFDDTNPVGRVHVGLLTTVPLMKLGGYVESAEPDKLELFLINDAFFDDHKDKLEGWAKLALRTFWHRHLEESSR